MPYERKCQQCNEIQILIAPPRGKSCKKCRLKFMSDVGLRAGTGDETKSNCSMGYRIVRRNNKGERIYQHRMVMEDFLGRKLRKDEHVHHIDGNKLNNDISNLEILSHSDHARKHFIEITSSGLSRAKEMSLKSHESKRRSG